MNFPENFVLDGCKTQGWRRETSTAKFDNIHVCYTRTEEFNKKREVVEIYSGENYIPDSKSRSYSRAYSLDTLPKKYQDLVASLKEHMIQTSKDLITL